jgi:hypothetical protein
LLTHHCALLLLPAGKTPEEIRKTFNIKVGGHLSACAFFHCWQVY